jgi:hypothetical protein
MTGFIGDGLPEWLFSHQPAYGTGSGAGGIKVDNTACKKT